MSNRVNSKSTASLRRLLAATVAPGAFVILATAARAETPAPTAQASNSPQVEEVIVTAEKRSENIQDVGMSITAFSGEQLEKQNISNASDLARFVPSLSIAQANNNRNSQITIRNVGTSGTNPGTETDVGVFIDGVYIPEAGPIYGELTDISTVEVLRGPQGTLYGRNTPMGAVNITTRAPTDVTEGMADLEYGNYGEIRAKGDISGKIAENLDGRLSFWTDSHDGYLQNLYTGTPVDSEKQYGARGRLRWKPDSETTIDVIGYYGRISGENNSGVQIDPLGPGGIVFGYNPTPTSFATSPFVIAQTATNPLHPYVVPGKWQVDSATASPDDTTTWGGSIQVSRNLPTLGVTLTDIFAYTSYQDYAANNGPGGLPLALANNLQSDTDHGVTNELRVTSNGHHFIDYVAGLYFLHDELSYAADKTTLNQDNRVFPAAMGGGTLNPGDFANVLFNETTNAIAAYSQATAHLTNRFRIIGGLRFSDDAKSSTVTQTTGNSGLGIVSAAFAKQTGGNATLSGSLVSRSLTYTAGAQYDVTEGFMLYATFGSGFKDGGFNSRSATALPYAFAPETSQNYEIGAKTSWFDHRLVLNVDLFRTYVDNYQQSTLLPSGVGFVINNAGNFRNQGVEVDLQAHPIAPLTFNGSLSYVNSVVTGGAQNLQCDTTYPFAGSAPPPSSGPFTDATHKTCNFNGLTLAGAPQTQWSIGVRWEQPLRGTNLNWFVSPTLTGQSSEYLDPSLDPRSLQPGYILLGGTMGVETQGGKIRVQLWGENLTDQRYFNAAAAQTQGVDVSAGGTKAANGFIGWLGVPRTFGIEATYQF